MASKNRIPEAKTRFPTMLHSTRVTAKSTYFAISLKSDQSGYNVRPTIFNNFDIYIDTGDNRLIIKNTENG